MADILISKFTTQIPRAGATPATPGFAESEGQDPVAPSGTPQVYTPVTIGSPANGLSISGTQVLTIGLASTSTTGALSSTDWNTFNGKIGGTIASGQVAFATGSNTIGGDADFLWNSTTNILTIQGRIVPNFGTSNVLVGDQAGRDLTTGNSNLGFGSAAIQKTTTGVSNTALGVNSLRENITSSNNTAVGGNALLNALLGSNLAIGVNAGRWFTGLNNAQNITGSIFIGNNAQAFSNTSSGEIVIGVSAVGLGNNTTVIGTVGTVATVFPAGSLWVNTTSGTNTLDINGTARIRTINNLGTAATSVLVPSATGVVSFRTLAELSADMGNAWTSVGTGNIFRNSRISVGHTADPTESIDLGASGWIRTGQGASNAGGVILPFTSANANSRSWTFRNDAGAFGEIGLTVSATQAGDPKTGNLIFRLTNIGNVGINGAPDAFSNYRYFSLYGASTTLGGVFIAKTSNGSHTFQLRVDSTANHLQALNNPMIFYCGTGGAERMRITNDGNLLINTTTDLGYRLYNVGTTGLDGNITLIDTTGTNIVFGTTTGTRIGTATNQRLAFWNKTPIVQPTNAIGAGAFVANTSGIANDTATYGGYTMGQIAQALINVGILA